MNVIRFSRLVYIWSGERKINRDIIAIPENLFSKINKFNE